MTEIRFSYTPAEKHWRWLVSTLMQRRWFNVRVLAFLSIAIGLLFIANNSFTLGPGLLAAGIVMLAGPPIAMRVSIRRLNDPLIAGERQIVISDAGVEVTTAVARSWYDLILIKRVLGSKDGWIVLTAGGSVTMVPREFLTDDQAESMKVLAARVSAGG